MVEGVLHWPTAARTAVVPPRPAHNDDPHCVWGPSEQDAQLRFYADLDKRTGRIAVCLGVSPFFSTHTHTSLAPPSWPTLPVAKGSGVYRLSPGSSRALTHPPQ